MHVDMPADPRKLGSRVSLFRPPFEIICYEASSFATASMPVPPAFG
jgi:hypothetical protein